MSSPTPSSRSRPEQVLSLAQSGREVLQDFTPLADSLEWELGQEYLRQRGARAFLADPSPVPYVVNNDGTLSRHAAEVFLASLDAAPPPAEEDLFVLELGVGVGLFARFFLDHFRALCRDSGRDYYDRLCYIAADRSERMLADLLRQGVLDDHPGRWRVRLVDAMAPEESLPGDLMFHGRSGPPLRAVFLNYLLDCLPASVLLLDDPPRQLHVRTCLGRSVRLHEHTDLSLADLRLRAGSSDPALRRELLEVYGLFASEYDYRPANLETLPHAELAVRHASRHPGRVLHSWGAIRCLEKLLELLQEDGLILLNDYGQTQTSTAEEFEHQRFSLATFVGVNFPLLEAHFADDRGLAWAAPQEAENAGIHARLLAHRIAPQTQDRFLECFGAERSRHLQEPVEQARACLQSGRLELAAGFYRQALARQPGNWVLLGEVSQFLSLSLGDPRAGVDMARLALRLNPRCSSELWNTLGDGLYAWGRLDEAVAAYRQALRISPGDVRAQHNLAWTHAARHDLPRALEAIARALALDRTGEHRERLLHKQQEVLARLGQRHQQEHLLLANLVSRHAPDEGPARRAALSRPVRLTPELSP